MKTYRYIEDYIELLAGYDPNSSTGIIFGNSTHKFSLARYDVQIVESMANSTMWNTTALTDKQGELAVKLVLKYRKQFATQGIDVSPAENPVWRKPLRTIDRSKSIQLVDSRINIKFPYDQQLIDDLRKFKEISQGSVRWNNDDKVWDISLTEYNINWVVTWGELQKFTIDPEVYRVFQQVLDCEQQPYEIKLVQTAGGFEITNAANSLVEYVNENLGGFGYDNLTKLVDHAGILGYTVDDAIDCPQILSLFGSLKKVYVDPNPENLDYVFDYAELTNRYPICIYNPGIEEMDLSRFNEADIVRFDRNGKTKTSNYNPYDVKVVYAQKIPATWDFPVPLLITTFEMMFGGRKMAWTQRAERIIYFSKQLRNNNGSSQTSN